MFGFGYALVPLYDVFCEVTGINGKTGTISKEDAEQMLADRLGSAGDYYLFTGSPGASMAGLMSDFTSSTSRLVVYSPPAERCASISGISP